MKNDEEPNIIVRGIMKFVGAFIGLLLFKLTLFGFLVIHDALVDFWAPKEEPISEIFMLDDNWRKPADPSIALFEETRKKRYHLLQDDFKLEVRDQDTRTSTSPAFFYNPTCREDHMFHFSIEVTEKRQKLWLATKNITEGWEEIHDAYFELDTEHSIEQVNLPFFWFKGWEEWLDLDKIRRIGKISRAPKATLVLQGLYKPKGKARHFKSQRTELNSVELDCMRNSMRAFEQSLDLLEKALGPEEFMKLFNELAAG